MTQDKVRLRQIHRRVIRGRRRQLGRMKQVKKITMDETQEAKLKATNRAQTPKIKHK